MEIASLLASMADWSTTAVLFCVLNLMIATIFIASNFKSSEHHHDNTSSQLARSPSLLERVKSVNLSSFYTTTESHDQDKVHSETTEWNSPSQLSPPPSLLQRVRSIDFSFFPFKNSIPTETEQLGNSPSERTRNLSLIDRVRSFKLTSTSNSDQHSGDTSSVKDAEDDSLSGVTLAGMSPSKVTESSREKNVAVSGSGKGNDGRQRRATVNDAVRVPQESVDAKADDFIKRFKQHLKLQRLDSLQKLREMLNRGT